MQSLINVFQAVIDFFSAIVDWVVLLFSRCLEYFFSILADLIEGILAGIDSVIPDLSSYFANLNVITPYVGFINNWIALDVAFTLLGLYLTYISLMISVKLIIKLFIPTVG